MLTTLSASSPPLRKTCPYGRQGELQGGTARESKGVSGDGRSRRGSSYYLGEANYQMGRQAMDRILTDQGIKYLMQANPL